MSYTPTTWIDRNVTTPDNYTITKSGGGPISSSDVVTMTVSAGTVTQEGTPVNASNLNKIENAVDTLNDEALRVEKVTQAITTTGSSNAYVVTNTNVYTSYVSGMIINIKANFSNTGSATINVDGLGAKTIKKQTVDGKVVVGINDIISGATYILIYDGTDFLVDSWSYPYNTVYTPSNNVLLTMNTERTTASSSYVTLKEFKLDRAGLFRINGERKTTYGGDPATWGGAIRIYNSTRTIALNTPAYFVAPTTYETFTIDTSVYSGVGDSIQIQGIRGSNASADMFIKNITVCGDRAIDSSTIVTD
jgi:hypothetical protein